MVVDVRRFFLYLIFENYHLKNVYSKQQKINKKITYYSNIVEVTHYHYQHKIIVEINIDLSLIDQSIVRQTAEYFPYDIHLVTNEYIVENLHLNERLIAIIAHRYLLYSVKKYNIDFCN